MKKIIALILALLMALSLCACSEKEESQPAAETPAPAQTPAPPTPTPEPDWEPAQIRAGRSEIVWKSFKRGDEITVLGRLDDWYIISGEDADLFISQRYVRLDSEAAFEERTGYARSGAKLLTSPDFSLEDGIELNMNTELKIIDGKDDWFYVECESGSGYISADSVSDYYIDYYSYSGAYDGGGGGGGGYSSGADGGDIALTCHISGRVPAQLLGSWNGPEYEAMKEVKATVLCDGTEAYLCLFQRGDSVRVTEKGDDKCTLFIGELFAELPRWQLSFEGDEAYESWEAFAQSDARLCKEYQLENEIKTLVRNDRLLIVDAFEELEIYVVEFEGQTGYLRFEDVSETEIYIYDPWSGGDGGSGGGGGAEWTPPAL